MKIALGIFIVVATLSACGESADNYNARARTVADSIMANAALAEAVTDLYENAWSDAIQASRDFNAALSAQKLSMTESGLIPALEKDKVWIDSVMKTLANGPEKTKDSYQKVMEFYGKYTQYYDLAVSPSGSLMSFRANTNNLSGELVKLSNELKVMGLLSEQKK